MAPSRRTLQQLQDLFDEGHYLTLAQIAGRFDVTERHARRLIRSLRKAGSPIEETRQGRRKLFFIPETHRSATLRDVTFTEEETLALAVAAEAARATLLATPLGAPLQRAFDKLLTELAPHVYSFSLEDQPAHWHFGPMGFGPIDADVFRTLSRAIEESRTVRIDYHTAQSNTYTRGRVIDPLLIGMPGGSWVVVAWCHKRRDFRDFALAGIRRIEKTERYFNPPGEFDPETYFRDRFGALAGEVMTVRLLVEKDRAPYFERKLYHPSQRIEERREDGRMVVSFEAAGLEAVRAFCQSWGVGLTVLEPPELAARMAEEAHALARRYGGERGAS